jgi:hypothetical protein
MSIQIVEIALPTSIDSVSVGLAEPISIVEIRQGPAGPGGGGTNSVTSATTSDGTADLDLLNVETVTATVTGTLTADHIHGNLAGSVYAHIRAGEALEKGDPVYVSGSHGSGSTLIPIVSKADASNAAKMPAIGIMDAAVANNANGHMVITGTITELDTTGLTVNAELYVAAGGGMTATPLTARAQPVARVERVNANNGAVIVKVNGLSASDATGSTLVRRDSNGGASLEYPTFGSGFQITEAGGSDTFGMRSATGDTWSMYGPDYGDFMSFSKAGVITFSPSGFTYGTGAASAHRIALGGVGDSSTGTALFGAADAAAANATLGVVSKRKTTQTNRNNSTTYTTDSDFTIPVTAGKTYRVEFAIYTTAGAGGFKGQFTIPSVPANITISANGVGLTSQPGAAIVALAMTTGGVIGAAALTRGTSTTNGTYHGFFEVTIGTTGGNLLFQWSQASASADNTSVLANSTVTAIERSY